MGTNDANEDNAATRISCLRFDHRTEVLAECPQVIGEAIDGAHVKQGIGVPAHDIHLFAIC